MTLRKLLKVLVGLLFFFTVFVGLISINHPIILKWVIGSARIIGKPINATAYTDGQVNSGIKVYKVDGYLNNTPNTPAIANAYLLHLAEFDKVGKLEFININLDQVWIGRPVGIAKDDYDYILGYLFQSETGGHFVDFRHDMKGYGFDPKLIFNENQIKFNVPPDKLTFDSIVIKIN